MAKRSQPVQQAADGVADTLAALYIELGHDNPDPAVVMRFAVEAFKRASTLHAKASTYAGSG